jgi:hypothetical protein
MNVELNTAILATRLAKLPPLKTNYISEKNLGRLLEDEKNKTPFASNATKAANLKQYITHVYGGKAVNVLKKNYIPWLKRVPRGVNPPTTIPEGQEGGSRRSTRRRRRLRSTRRHH